MAQIQELDTLKIPFQDIKLATNNFSDDNIIGKGRFGRVYKGQLPHSTSSNEPTVTVVVKRLDKTITGQGPREFALEIIVLASYKHCNLASLLGFSDNGDEKILVYKYEINGSLDKHLASTNLTWEKRLRICLGVARGLDYLHGGVGTGHRAIHRDIKSSNILLDDNWEAKISDFGLLSNICPLNQEFTSGHVDPEYEITGILTKESDVYSFGVVLFEIISGKLAEYHDDRDFQSKIGKLRYNEKNHVEYVEVYDEEEIEKEIEEENKSVDEIIMTNIQEQMKLYSKKLFSDIAYECLDKSPKRRPSMKSIVQELKSSFDYQIGSPTELWGSTANRCPWSLLLENNMKLKKITLNYEDWIISIGFTVEDLTTGSLISSQHGGTGGQLSEINFDADEEIIGVLGTFGTPSTEEYICDKLILSLCIVTNKRRYGPFGEETQTRFSVPWDVGSFAGFYGCSMYNLEGLGFYSKISR